MDFITGRNNLACTIFVPFDCNNKCPFCTSKEMYSNGKFKLDIDAIIESVVKINHNTDIQEYVLTGGEPFANLPILKKIVNVANKPIFINTTLPLHNGDIDEIIDYINNEEKIKGINISRHIGFNFTGVADLNMIDRIEKPIRINTVMPKNVPLKIEKGINILVFEDFMKNFYKFVEEWGNEKRLINLRADYSKITFENLKSFDIVEQHLATKYRHMGGGGCLVCNTVLFDAGKCFIQYHRGKMYSSVTMGDNKTYINDVIMAMDGTIYPDWSFEADKKFNEWVYRHYYIALVTHGLNIKNKVTI